MLEVNGTLTDRGEPIDGGRPRLVGLGGTLTLHVLSADTYGTAEAVAAEAPATFGRASHGDEKRGSILAALDLLLEPTALAATPRA